MATILYKWMMILSPFVFSEKAMHEMSHRKDDVNRKSSAANPIAIGSTRLKSTKETREKKELFHPIFVSVTEIEHNAKDKTLEISCKLFTDDFEKTLRKTYSGKVDLVDEKMKTNMSTLVNSYIQKHLSVSVDGKQIALQLIGFEQQEEGIVSYFQGNNIAVAKNINVFDNLLYEYSNQQMGIIHVTVNGNRKSSRLNNPDSNASFSF